TPGRPLGAPAPIASGGGNAAADSAREAFPPGCRVRHPQFGEGTIESIQAGQLVRAKVKFRTGTKTLVLEYARLRRID
ncbi:MAG: DNA helicase II, partial [Planctomycetota bacterium]